MFERARNRKSQSSLELLITLSFGLTILLPIVVLAFLQVSSSTSAISAAQAQNAASKLASVATAIGSQGAPAKQLVLVQVPPGVQNIYIGNLNNGVGHQITFVVGTSGGASYVTSYSPVNVSGDMGAATLTGTYLINVSAQSSCPSSPGIACVYITST
jgi:uncharacterized protein (UPF0333 family)